MDRATTPRRLSSAGKKETIEGDAQALYQPVSFPVPFFSSRRHRTPREVMPRVRTRPRQTGKKEETRGEAGGREEEEEEEERTSLAPLEKHREE